MRIGGLGSVYPTYVYNPNVVSSKSMNKLSRISDDVLDKKVDYTGIEAQKENQNPLKKGQTIDFEGIFAKQIQQGQSRAARIIQNRMIPEEKKAEAETTRQPERKEMENFRPEVESMAGKTAENASDAASGNNATFMQMQRAIQAYEMFMTA